MSGAFHDDECLNPSGNPAFAELLENPGRRTVLKGALASAVAMIGLPACTVVPSSATGFLPIAASGEDAVRVPEAYEANVLVAWGDPIGIPGAMPAFRFDASNSAAEQEVQSGTHHDGMHYFPLPLGSQNSAHGLLVINHEYPDHHLMFSDGARDWSNEKARKSQHALGCSVQEIRLSRGRWALVRPSRYAQRIHANTPMRLGGPAAGHALMRTEGSPDGKGCIGTFGNCANGWTPWGTYLSCEENFVPYFAPPGNPTPAEARYGFLPNRRYASHWSLVDPRFDASKNRNEVNHFGWVVELDPYDAAATLVKRTALGRFSHESAASAICRDRRVAFYMGDDQPFEYLYKFITARAWNPANRAANRDLLDEGTLYVARFAADGSGEWVELTHGRNGLTAGNGFDSQAEVVIHARAASDLVGATKMDRPEWTAVDPRSGDVYVTLTNNGARGGKDREGANPANPRAPNRYGHIVRWREAGGDAAATRFAWEVFALAGDPSHADEAQRGDVRGDLYAAPDGLMIDARGVLWVQTDVSPSALTKGEYSVFGNNQMLAVDASTRETKRFLTGPRGCEVTGACMTPDGRTLFVNMQHPGEVSAQGADPDDPRQSSNWPDYRPDGRPRSGTVAIRRNDGGIIGT